MAPLPFPPHIESAAVSSKRISNPAREDPRKGASVRLGDAGEREAEPEVNAASPREGEEGAPGQKRGHQGAGESEAGACPPMLAGGRRLLPEGGLPRACDPPRRFALVLYNRNVDPTRRLFSPLQM